MSAIFCNSVFNLPVSFRKPLLNSESESMLNTELNLVVCSIKAIDLDDCPLIPGCTDPVACNYNNDAQEDDGSCEYPNLIDGNCSVIQGGNDSSGTYCNCLTQCMVEVDCTGECGGSVVVDECGDCDGPHFNFNGLIFDNGNCDCDFKSVNRHKWSTDAMRAIMESSFLNFLKYAFKI